MTNSPQPNSILARTFLPFLLFLSGFCGISYEVLYTRLLGNLLGMQFIINAAVLLTFLLGVGFGTLYAHRFMKFLWLIEALLGAYAALMVVLQGNIDTLIYSEFAFVSTSLYGSAVTAFCLLVIPAFLVGCSVPLFAAYLSTFYKLNAFSVTYAIYNLGAAITVIAMEFLLLRTVGLSQTMLCLAALNEGIALTLFFLIQTRSISVSSQETKRRFPVSHIVALSVASTASAVFQLTMIKVSEFVLGPYNETFALVLATVLIGLSFGACLVRLTRLSFEGALILCLLGLFVLLSGLPLGIGLFSSLYDEIGKSYFSLIFLKFGFVFLCMLLPAVGFGATIPALLVTHKHIAKESGELLFYSSMANAFGFLLMAFWLHRAFEYGSILVCLSGAVFASLIIYRRGFRLCEMLAVFLVLLAAVARYDSWDEILLYAGHTNFHSPEACKKARDRSRTAEWYKGPQDVFAILEDRDDHEKYFFINGYISIPLASSAEKVVGATSAMLAPRLDEALVLGVGSGATASTVGLAFKHTDAVEINKVVLDNLFRMKNYNFDIEKLSNVNIIHDDGIRYVKTTSKRYSLILNTVTSPRYFSSSKLYTEDFVEIIADKLTPDGIYTTWIDHKIGDRGVDIITETLGKVFPHCWMLYLRSSYYQFVCSKGDIGLWQYSSVSKNPRLSRYFLEEYQLPLELLPYGILSSDGLEFKREDTASVNTLDFPVLEFEMSRLRHYKFKRFGEVLSKKLDLRMLEKTLRPWLKWNPGSMLLYANLRMGTARSTHKLLRRLIFRKFGNTGKDYAKAASDYAKAVDTAKAYRKTGTSLMKKKRYQEALELLELAATRKPKSNNVQYYIGRCHYKLDEYENAIEAFDKEWDLDKDKDVPLMMARALIKLSRYKEALSWLDKAEELGEDRDVVRRYRKRAGG